VKVAGGADGFFGKATAAAVRRFQTAASLPATGSIDEATAVAVGLNPARPHLALGASGTKVRALQQQLAETGIHVRGGADGRYGPSTAAAVRAFQAVHRLPLTGTLDAWTAAVLEYGAAHPASSASSTALVPGSSGPAIAALQRRLIAVGARPAGGADGQYGTATRRAVALFQRWAGLPSTGVVDTRTASALTVATAPRPVAVHRLASFPLPHTCTFWNTWGAPRAGGRHHQGTDIFARLGTPVLAVADGRIVAVRHDVAGSRGGNQFWLRGRDGTTYFYGHLSGFAEGVGVGVPVSAGQTLGYAGKTGLTTVVHLHFEVHPHGGPAVNPYAVLRVTAGC
jgi:peptidoglycan hydrolase-like protein with peptidoglycan-binding domain